MSKLGTIRSYDNMFSILKQWEICFLYLKVMEVDG